MNTKDKQRHEELQDLIKSLESDIEDYEAEISDAEERIWIAEGKIATLSAEQSRLEKAYPEFEEMKEQAELEERVNERVKMRILTYYNGVLPTSLRDFQWWEVPLYLTFAPRR